MRPARTLDEEEMKAMVIGSRLEFTNVTLPRSVRMHIFLQINIYMYVCVCVYVL